MAEPILMPRQGQSVETCIITKWLKSKGERIEEGDPLFSYETDKAAFDETSEVSGVLLDVFYDEGEEVPVLSTIAVVGEEGEDISAYIPGDAAEEIRIGGDEAGAEGAAKAEGSSGAGDGTVVGAGSGTGSEAGVGDGTGARAGAEPAGKLRISPRARKMAEAHQIDPIQITGSGPNGRIICRDIEESIESGKQPHQAIAKTIKTVAGPAAFQPGPIPPGEEVTEEPLSNIRRIIAQKMHESLQVSAQLTHHTSADARGILSLRKKIKSGEISGLHPKTNLNDMVCYAVVRALSEFPDMNAHFTGESIRKFRSIHLGIAVDTERGLMVPSLRNADRYNLGGLGEALKELAASCKNGTVDPDLLSAESATFTISNLGTFDVEMFTPVLNLPQCGILGVNTIIHRPADTGDGTIAFIPHIGISLTYDHRALDGAPASRFLQLVKQKIETLETAI